MIHLVATELGRHCLHMSAEFVVDLKRVKGRNLLLESKNFILILAS